MAGISLDVLRVGKKYRLVNHGEVHEFTIERILTHDDFVVKDMLTLESYHLNDLIKYGKGKDYLLEEIIPGNE